MKWALVQVKDGLLLWEMATAWRRLRPEVDWPWLIISMRMMQRECGIGGGIKKQVAFKCVLKKIIVPSWGCVYLCHYRFWMFEVQPCIVCDCARHPCAPVMQRYRGKGWWITEMCENFKHARLLIDQELWQQCTWMHKLHCAELLRVITLYACFILSGYSDFVPQSKHSNAELTKHPNVGPFLQESWISVIIFLINIIRGVTWHYCTHSPLKNKIQETWDKNKKSRFYCGAFDR